MPALADDFRAVFVVPVAVADALSATRIVTMSSTRLARRSRTASTNCPVLENNEPGVAESVCCERFSTLLRYLSNADSGSLGISFFGFGMIPP